MLDFRCLRAATLFLVALLGTIALPLRAELTQEEVAAAKLATAFVMSSAGQGTAFCISEAGFFVTCDHVIDGANPATLAIVVTPAEASEKRYPAKIVRRLKASDLAILKVALDRKLPALRLGEDAKVFETQAVSALGYPFGQLLASNEKSYPSISVNLGRVSSLRRKDGVLDRIQFDAQVNPGNSGGPVLDATGSVVGIVDSGVPGSGINFAVPVSSLRKGIETPIVGFATSKTDRQRGPEPVEVTLTLDWIIPPPEEPKVSIEIRGGGPPRKVSAEKGPDGKYRGRISPVSAPGPAERAALHVTLHFDSGLISGAVADRDLSIAGQPKALGDFKSLRRAPNSHDFDADGKSVGPLPELAALALDVGGATVSVDARKATVIEIEKPSAAVPPIYYKALVTLANGKELPSEEKMLDFGSAPTPPPVLRGKVELTGARTLALPTPISDVVAAQDGRSLLLHLKEAKKLAVFDVIDLKIRGFINLDEDKALFAGGSRYILVVCQTENVIQRYSVETLQKEKTVSNSFGTITNLSMGISSPSLALLVSSDDSPFNTKVMAFDAESMSLVATAERDVTSQLSGSSAIVRASADGRTFGFCRRGVSPTGFIVVTFRDNAFAVFYEHESPGILVPNADGTQIFAQTGIYTNKYIPVVKSQGALSSGATYLPSYHPMYFISVPSDDMRFGREKHSPKTIGIYLTGSSQALLQTSEDLKEMHNASQGIRMNAMDDPITVDERYYSYPQFDMLLTIPPTNDKIVAHPLNIRQLLDEKGIDYLFVTSTAPFGKISTPYRYQIQAASKTGGVKFTLQSGPAGLTVSSAGEVAWNTPAQPTEEVVIVSLKDGSGREEYHTFRIVVTR